MSKYENENFVEDQDLIPEYVETDIEVDAECEKTGLTTGQAIGLGALGALAAGLLVKGATKLVKFVAKKVDERRKSNELRQPEEGTTVEPSDKQILDTAGY